MKRTLLQFCVVALLVASSVIAGDTFELRGRVTNELTEEQHRAVTVVVTDRLGTELARTRPDKSGRYQIKISGPQFIIIKAELEGFPTLRYQLDTKQYKESTTDREENRVFGEMRIQTYYQNITFGVAQPRLEVPSEAPAPMSLEELLANEEPAVVKDYQEARRQREGGALKKAVDSFEKLTKKHPEFYIGLVDFGMILVAQQENDRALDVFTRARDLRPGHSWGYIGLGMVLNNKKDYQGASQHLEKAVSLEPTSVNAQFQLGFALFNLGEMDRSLTCFQRVVDLNPAFNPMAYKYISSIYVKKNNAAGAGKALRSYLAQFPDAPDRDRVEQILKKLGQ